MWYVYILKSEKYRKSYVGCTDDVGRRLNEHNKGKGFYTRKFKPWILLSVEKFTDYSKARQREKFYKSGIGRQELKKLIYRGVEKSASGETSPQASSISSRVITRENRGCNINMTYVVYIIKNPDQRYYIGYTKDIDKRVKKHNLGHTKSTKNKGEWVVVYKEKFILKSDAINREKYIKAQKSKKFIESLIYRGVEK